MGKLTNIRRTKMLAQDGRCYYCGLLMWNPEVKDAAPEICLAPAMQRYLRCTAEHLLPRSEGGTNTSSNIVAACWYCNTRRHRRRVPPSPAKHLARVQQSMAKGKWLAAYPAARSQLMTAPLASPTEHGHHPDQAVL